MEEQRQRTSFRAGILGVIFGGVTGFLLGLLLAPEEGQRLRRRLSYRLEHLGEQVSSLADEILSPETESDARRTGDALVADANVRAQRIRNDIDTLLGEMRQQGSISPPGE